MKLWSLPFIGNLLDPLVNSLRFYLDKIFNKYFQEKKFINS